MNFKSDRQTLDDLNIFGKPGKAAIFNLYNNTSTRGGMNLLEQMFLYPLTDITSINKRSAVIRFFAALNLPFPIAGGELGAAEIYLEMTDPRTRLTMENQDLGRKFGQLMLMDGDYKLILKGMEAIRNICHALTMFLEKIRQQALSTPYREELEALDVLLHETTFTGDIPANKMNYETAVALDGWYRFTVRKSLLQILHHVYHLDVYIGVAGAANKKNYCYPEATTNGDELLDIRQCYHPLINGAKGNDIIVRAGQNVLFLTGANMGGKSTFMKSVGIALYTAHLGFPVAATSMKFSVMDGIFTTINLPDDLSAGNSHFYAEVLRVKQVAKELKKGRKLFVIFDELFRGTNVKDAYDGTVVLTKGFAKKSHSVFIISTHITEAGHQLKDQCNNIRFIFLPTYMEGNTPRYTYQLTEGITEDRHGMVIINNEGILDILENGRK